MRPAQSTKPRWARAATLVAQQSEKTAPKQRGSNEATMNVAKLKSLLADLPDNMEVRMHNSIDDECGVHVVEVYQSKEPAAGLLPSRMTDGTILLSNIPGQGHGAKTIFDDYEGGEP